MMVAVPASAARKAPVQAVTPAVDQPGGLAVAPLDPGVLSAGDGLLRFADLWRHAGSTDAAPRPDGGDAVKPAQPDDTPEATAQAASPEATPAFAPWPGLVTAIAPVAIDVDAVVARAPASSVTGVAAPRDTRAPALASTSAPAAASAGPETADAAAASSRTLAPRPGLVNTLVAAAIDVATPVVHAAASSETGAAAPRDTPAPTLTPTTVPTAADAGPDVTDAASGPSRALAPRTGLLTAIAPAAIDVATVVRAPASSMTGAAAPRDTRAPALPSTGAPAKASAAVAAPIRDLAASTPRADVPVAAGAGPDPADAASASSRPPVPAPVHERVATPAPDGALGAPPWAAAATPVSGNPDAPVVTVKLAPAAPEQWRQPLAEALGDRLRLQLGRGSEQAVIRLDPPMLGRIEISIRHEAGSLQVQLSASNGDVLRQLHGIGDGLRQELSQRQQGEVSVVVSDSSRDAGAGGDQRGRGRDAKDAEDRPGRALTEAGTDDAARAGFGLAREGRDAA